VCAADLDAPPTTQAEGGIATLAEQVTHAAVNELHMDAVD
jgi:hypothetical protein